MADDHPKLIWVCPTCGIEASVRVSATRIICGCQRGSSMSRSHGVGTELRKMLGCGCQFNFGRLDEWGTEKCLAEFDAIVAELVDMIARHKEPISKEAAERLLRMAIERADALPVAGK